MKDKRSEVFSHRAEITTKDGEKVYLVLNSFEQFLAKLDLQIKEKKAQIPEIFTLLPPSADGIIHIDKDMESANACFKAGLEPRIHYHEDGKSNERSEKVRAAWLVFRCWNSEVEAGGDDAPAGVGSSVEPDPDTLSATSDKQGDEAEVAEEEARSGSYESESSDHSDRDLSDLLSNEKHAGAPYRWLQPF